MRAAQLCAPCKWSAGRCASEDNSCVSFFSGPRSLLHSFYTPPPAALIVASFLRLIIQIKIPTAIITAAATPTPIPAFIPTGKSVPFSCAAMSLWGGALDVIELLGVDVCGAKSPAFQRIEMPLALMPTALVVLEILPDFVKVHSWLGLELSDVHLLCAYQANLLPVCAM